MKTNTKPKNPADKENPNIDSRDNIEIKNNHDESLSKIKQRADETIKGSLEYASDISQKIDKSVRDGIQKAKDSQVVHDIQDKVTYLRTMDQKEKNKHKRRIVRALIRFRDIIFGLIETFVGRIRVGTQYGKSSIDLLSELAKLKELGIITEKEFEDKKKEILDRI